MLSCSTTLPRLKRPFLIRRVVRNRLASVAAMDTSSAPSRARRSSEPTRSRTVPPCCTHRCAQPNFSSGKMNSRRTSITSSTRIEILFWSIARATRRVFQRRTHQKSTRSAARPGRLMLRSYAPSCRRSTCTPARSLDCGSRASSILFSRDCWSSVRCRRSRRSLLSAPCRRLPTARSMVAPACRKN